jgi:outer membrane protein
MKKILKVAAICVTGAVQLAPAQSETLRDALVGAYTHSGLLDQNRALLRAADEDVAVAVSALRPVVNWSASVAGDYSNSTLSGRNSTTDLDVALGLNATLLLWDGGRSKLSIESAKETVLATRQQLLSIEQQVFMTAVQAYFNVRREVENVALRRSNLRLITQELRAAEDRREVGEVTRTDVAQAQARLAEAKSGLADAQGALVQAQEAYANVVGHRPGALAAPRGLPRLDRSVVKAKERAVRNHPDMKQVQHQVAAAELVIQRAERVFAPQVQLEGTLSKQDGIGNSTNTDFAELKLEMSGPIYRGGALPSAVRSATAQRDALRGNLHRVRHIIRQNVGNAYAQLQVSQAQLVATQERIRAARVAFDGVREEATLGARTTLDVLNAEQALLEARASRITAEAQSYIAAYSVLQAMGKLTATDLRLNVQQYDPEAYYDLVKDAPHKRSEQGQKLDRVLRSLQK